MSVDDTLNERGKKYGSFMSVAELAQDLKLRIGGSLYNLDKKMLAADQMEAIDMICTKIARIVNGDADHIDNWHDIAGYARLVEMRLLQSELPRMKDEALKPEHVSHELAFDYWRERDGALKPEHVSHELAFDYWRKWDGGNCPFDTDEPMIYRREGVRPEYAIRFDQPTRLRWDHTGSSGDIHFYKRLRR